jgi:hypothetical protein
MRFFRPYIVLLIAVFISAATVSAQKVRLRSRSMPDCAVGGYLKYADIYADGNIAVMGGYSCRGAFIFDISNPDSPALSSWYNPGANQQFLEAIVIGNRGYFGSGNGGGVHIVDLSNPASPVLLGIVNSANGGGFNSIHEMVVHRSGGVDYLIENANNTSQKLIKIINVTDPAAAILVNDMNPNEVQWVHAMHIRGDRMYTSGFGNSTERAKTEIYDISQIGTQSPVFLGEIVDPSESVTAGNNMHSSWTSEDGKYLYSAREVGGSSANGASPGDIRVYDVTDPAVPLLVKRITMTDLGLNAVTPHNPVVKGNRLYVSWYQAGLQIFDISNPVDPKRIGQYDTYYPEYAPQTQARKIELSDRPWDIYCGRESDQNSVPENYNGAWAVYPFLGEDRVLIGDLFSGLLIVDTTGLDSPAKNIVSDFDGDQKTDLSVQARVSGLWTVNSSSGDGVPSVNWGQDGDIPVAGDYDGDGVSEFAVWRPSTGVWWVYDPVSGIRTITWGVNGDVPVAADYDADGKTDFAVWRPSDGKWYVIQSTLGMRILHWGVTGDQAFGGDFEGDGKADFVIWRPSTGVWYVYRSSSSMTRTETWGVAGDKPLFGDFDGDGKAEFAIYRPSTGMWWILNRTANSITTRHFGIENDIPVPADYDGDGRTDIAVFRPETKVWYRLNSSNGQYIVLPFGQGDDRPSPASVQPQ